MYAAVPGSDHAHGHLKRTGQKKPCQIPKGSGGASAFGALFPASRLTSKEAFLRHAGRRNIKIRSAVVGAQQRDNGLLFISLCALPQNAQNAAGICDNGARFPRLSDKARWCPTSRRIYHFRCAAGDECNGTLHYKAAGAAADQPFFIL